MDKLAANLSSTLLHHLLNTRGESARVTSTSQSGQTQQFGNMQAGSTLLSLPPALRQLLNEQASVHQLLPRIQAAQPVLSTAGLEQVFSTLATHLSGVGSSIRPAAIQQLVSQWFAFNPAQALTTTPTATSGNWIQSLTPALLWVLLQRSQTGPVQNLLQRVFAQTQAQISSSHSLPPALSTLAANILGTTNSIRLSQVLLADTTATQQPDYYLVIPYLVGDTPRSVELLLKKRAHTKEQADSEYWLFSLRFSTKRFGPLLVKGRYGADHSNSGSTEASDNRPTFEPEHDLPGNKANRTVVRFYVEENAYVEVLNQELEELIARLQKAGLTGVKAEVFIGKVPQTLAPDPHELIKVSPKHGPKSY